MHRCLWTTFLAAFVRAGWLPSREGQPPFRTTWDTRTDQDRPTYNRTTTIEFERQPGMPQGRLPSQVSLSPGTYCIAVQLEL